MLNRARFRLNTILINPEVYISIAVEAVPFASRQIHEGAKPPP